MFLKAGKISVPVIIVGNITVGGTGKSPLVIHLYEQLKKAGYRIGILSRGYGAKANNYPASVEFSSNPAEVGDEPLMIKLRTGATVVVDPIRARGAQFLVEKHDCDLIICDDGLQHYALERDIELVVIDGERKLGNRLLMPFGPLREPVSRMKQVDGIIINNNNSTLKAENSFAMNLISSQLICLNDKEKTFKVADFIKHCFDEETKQQCQINAIAAIGNPQRFFNHLTRSGFEISPHAFIDHHKFTTADFMDMEGIILMTEKDAVKCKDFATDNMWYLKVDCRHYAFNR